MRQERRDEGTAGRGRRRRGAGRWLGIATGLMAGIGLLTAPAAAAEPGETRRAAAFWDLTDARQTRISVQGATSADPQDSGSLFLFVTQSFCDTATDEMVFRSFLGQETLDPATFRVHPLLKAASLDVTTTVSGSEQRLSGCAQPSGFPTFTDLGASTVEVDADWMATSDPYEVQPGVVGRDALATGTVVGELLSPGPLGGSQFAHLRTWA